MSKSIWTGKSIKGDIHQHPQENGCRNIKLQLHPYKVIILHPSMCCPDIIEEVSHPIKLVIATDHAFYQDVRSSKNDGKDKAGNAFLPSISRTISRFIKIEKWAKGKGSEKSELSLKDTLVSKDLNGSCDESYLRNICFSYLGSLSSHVIGPTNKGLGHFANMRDETVHYYKQQGLAHVYEIKLYGLQLTPDTLYDISWVIQNKVDPIDDKIYHEYQDANTRAFLAKDKYIGKELKEKGYTIDQQSGINYKQKNLPIQNHHFSYVAPSGVETLNIGHLTDVHVSSRQHVFKKCQAKLIPGQSQSIGPMVNSSFDTLKNLMDQYGNDKSIHAVFFTGDLIDYMRNYDPAAFPSNGKTGQLWDEMVLDNLNQYENGQPKKDKNGGVIPNTEKYPRSIDHVIMYSLFHYFYKQYGKPIYLTSGNHEAYTLPFGISPRPNSARSIKNTITAKIANNPVKTYVGSTVAGSLVGNPVAGSLTGAGSVAYSKDYQKKGRDQGIYVDRTLKDRIKDWEKRQSDDYKFNDIRANTGVPADHNLTFAEAILMYGPDYDRVVLGGSDAADTATNYKKENYKYFYTIFTPLADFVINYKKQCIVGFDWGKGERFTATAIDGQADFEAKYWGLNGFLPRATESLNKAQLRLLRAAKELKQPCTLMFSHFTLVNYIQIRPLSDLGEIAYTSTMLGYCFTDYNWGCCENNQRVLFEALFDQNIHYTFSGHSHRSALYKVDYDWGLINNSAKTEGVSASSSKGWTFDTSEFKKKDPKVLVTASGGPIAIQNQNGELGGWGLDYPSGSYIHFDNSHTHKTMGIKIPETKKVPQAEPRLAVALDYADLIGNSREETQKGVFTSIKSVTDDGPFEIVINEELKLPPIKWIESASIYVYETKPSPQTTINLGVKKVGLTRMNLGISKKDLKTFDNLMEKKDKKTLFIEYKFGQEVKTDIFKHYSIDKTWTYQIALYRPTIVRCNARGQGCRTVSLPEGYDIQRHPKYGEVPNHKWYSDYMGAEYKFPWEKYKIGSKKTNYQKKI